MRTYLMTSSKPNNLPKVSSTNIITSEGKTLPYELWGDTIQSTEPAHRVGAILRKMLVKQC
jgi:hypothetical protein